MKKVFLYSLKHSIPILISFMPLGIAYGILMQTSGYDYKWASACSLFVYAGSLQFLMVTFFAGGVSLAAVCVMALLLNSRHIFYGLPFVEKWREYGGWKYFLIFALTDEAFSLHCSNSFEDGNPRHKMFSHIFDAALIMFYWFAFSVIGALAGSYINFSTEGIDFAMTALFIVILLEGMKGASNLLPVLIAAVSSAVCLLIIGPANFILPSLVITVVILFVFRNRIEASELREERADHSENTEPENIELEHAEPENIELENAKPEHTEPENAEPENAEPENAEQEIRSQSAEKEEK